MELNLEKKTIIIAAILLVIAVVSFFWIAQVATDEGNFTGTYQSLEEKRVNVTELMAVTAGASTAISLLPGDAGTPIAEQLAGLSGYFLFILAAICLEKWLVTITGLVAFKIIIPIACLILIAAVLWTNRSMKVMGVKLVCFGLILFLLMPASVLVTKTIDATYQESLQQTINDTREDSKKIQDSAGKDDDGNALDKLVNQVKGGVSAKVEQYEQILNRITESIAVLIVTSCAIPIAVLIFFIWVVKLMTGISVQIPSPRIGKIRGLRRPPVRLKK